MRLQRLDALILNAGLGIGPYAETRDGLDSHMQVNVIAQHHLARTLLSLLVTTPDSRLCFQSSGLHRFGTDGIEFRGLGEMNRDVGPVGLYTRSKLAYVLLCRRLHRHKMRGELGLVPDSKIASPSAQGRDEELQGRCRDLVEGILEQKLGVSCLDKHSYHRDQYCTISASGVPSDFAT